VKVSGTSVWVIYAHLREDGCFTLKTEMKKLLKNIFKALGLEIRKYKNDEEIFFLALVAIKKSAPSNISSIENQFLEFCRDNISKSKSQIFQDLFVDFVIRQEKGVFCEFGATDGLSLSNSYYLENNRSWTGILVEPARKWHPSLVKNRPKSTIDYRCVYSESGTLLSFNETDKGEFSTIAGLQLKDMHSSVRKCGVVYEVETVSLNDLLDFHQVEQLDYLSIDTEGSEFKILERIDFMKHHPKIVTVEHNYTPNRQHIRDPTNHSTTLGHI